MKVRDLQLPPDARVIADPDDVLVTCVKPGEKAEETSEATEPEVIGRKPAEEGDSEG